MSGSRRRIRRSVLAVGAPTAVLALASCAGVAEQRVDAPESSRSASPSAPTATASATPSAGGTEEPAAAIEPAEELTAAGPAPSDGAPADASLAIPRLGLRDVTVVAYEGRTDDAEGTRIQNDGVAASPHGARGGTGPGGIGNYQVTAHRLSGGGLFRDLPDLQPGDRVRVTAAERTYVYEIRRTRITSFREPASLRAQRAPVPGRPGVEPTRAMLTLSTCRTLEDHAEGNFWSDEFDNPEHRIDKIGVLVRSTRA